MFNKNTLCISTILVSLLVVSILISYVSMQAKPLSVSFSVKNSGTIKGSQTIPTSPPSMPQPSAPQPSGGVEFIALISSLVSIITIVGTIAGLLKWLFKWLWWRKKYGRSRTPIVMPARTMRVYLTLMATFIIIWNFKPRRDIRCTSYG